MRGWYAVFQKELAGFFALPIAYAIVGSFLLLSGFGGDDMGQFQKLGTDF